MSDVSTAFEIIRTVAQTMVENKSAQPALEAVVNLISEKMQVDVCSIYLYNPERNSLRLTASCGLNPEKFKDVSMSPDEGLCGHVFSKGEVINIANPSLDTRNKHFPSLGEERLNNFLGIPIPPETRRSSGVLILQSTEDKPFPPTVEDLAYTLAAQLGTMLENTSLKLGSAQSTRDGAGSSLEAPPFIRAQVAFGGIACGPVTILKTHQVWDDIFFSEVENVKQELQLLHKSLEFAKKESRWLREKAGELFAEVDARIFETHEMMLKDIDFVGIIESHIREKMAAPFAVKLAVRELSKIFNASGNPYLITKSADLKDVGLRLLNALIDTRADKDLEEGEGTILAAVELLPSDLIYLQTKKVLGIVCETGGITSHAAILARSLNIPCFMGVPRLTSYLQNGMYVIMDGNNGLIYLRPDHHVQREYRRLLEELETRQFSIPSFESVSLDGVEIQLSGNISLLSDLELLERHGIKGVGLYRSEFFFMIRNHFPDENTQFEVYRKVVERCQPHAASIRLLDVGGDKPLHYFDWGKEENPYLGWRSIRMLLGRPDILMTHLRALLRASRVGKMKIILPMVAIINEIREIQSALAKAKEELEVETGESYPLPPVGAMIEIPSAVLQIRRIIGEVDFIAIGTNDLIQYLFAVDRGNERVAQYFQPYHPALISALSIVSEAAKDVGKEVTLCGEMAADPKCLPILLGLGFDRLSIAPASADSLRIVLQKLRVSDCQRLMKRTLGYSTGDQVREDVNQYLKDILGNEFNLI